MLNLREPSFNLRLQLYLVVVVVVVDLEVVGAHVLLGDDVPDVVVALHEGEHGEGEGGEAEVEAEQDSHPLAAHLHEVLGLPPAHKMVSIIRVLH